MIQPTQVLPSNASPLRNGDNVYHASRILQEHSGNRQPTDFSFGDEYVPKYPVPVLTENHFAVAHQHQHHQPQVPPLYHPQPRLRQPWRYGYARGGLRYNAPEEEARIRFDTERLYNRFRRSDQYVKYRNRQTKDDKGNENQKWPDHLEKAFFRALVQWPPMGRRKHFWKEKQRGRNELIADCIKELTGEGRTRKQVSSHIQVLKPFVENDPYIMKWLAKDDMGPHAGRIQGSSVYHTGRRMSNYPVMTPPQGVQNSVPALPPLDLQTLRKAKVNLDVFEPTDFSMFVQQKYKVSKEHEDVQRLHTYTQSIENPLEPDFHLDDDTLHQDFPLLATMHANRPLDCNVLGADASLAFPLKNWKGEDGSQLPGVELGINLSCMSRHLPPSLSFPTPRDRAYQIIVNNTFYENGVCAKDHSGLSYPRLEPAEREGVVETRVKFGSTFWARTLGRLAIRLLETSREHRDEVAAYLRTINAVQEIVLRSEQGHERLLVIHWKFRLSTTTRGRASWRRLLLPTQSSHYIPTCKDERVDSMYEYNHIGDTSMSQSQHAPTQLALQSPFEYESSFGSTLSSATWPTSLSDVGGVGQHDGAAEFGIENAFDFNAGNINFSYDSYDPGLTFDTFDSSAFNFDTSAADFAADPALQDYSQQWYDGYTHNFDDQQALAGNDSFAAQSDLNGHAPSFEVGGHYEPAHYVASQDQAFGGAVSDMTKDKDALAALADASYIASAIVPKHEPL